MSSTAGAPQGGQFSFDDGGCYTGSWVDGMSHGHGVCTGPNALGEYAGAWQYGFETSGVYTWRNGNYYEGQWLQGRRHGLGVECEAQWLYRGEWTQGYKGRYGVRQSTTSGAMYEGTWTSGLQDGYGVETYADGGTYKGQWLRGVRHGYGGRESVSYDLAARYRAPAMNAMDCRATTPLNQTNRDHENLLRERDRRLVEARGGFVLIPNNGLTADNLSALSSRKTDSGRQSRPSLRKALKMIRQRSTGDLLQDRSASSRRPGGSVRSTSSSLSQTSTESNATSLAYYNSPSDDDTQSFVSQHDLSLESNVFEVYWGEWKGDKRTGFGVCTRSDGVRYEGEWQNNKKNGYGVTTLADGTRAEGKYRNNVLVRTDKNSKRILLLPSKVKDKVQSAVMAAHHSAEIGRQKAEIAIARQMSARVKGEQSEQLASRAVTDARLAKETASLYTRDSKPRDGLGSQSPSVEPMRLARGELYRDADNGFSSLNHTNPYISDKQTSEDRWNKTSPNNISSYNVASYNAALNNWTDTSPSCLPEHLTTPTEAPFISRQPMEQPVFSTHDTQARLGGTSPSQAALTGYRSSDDAYKEQKLAKDNYGLLRRKTLPALVKNNNPAQSSASNVPQMLRQANGDILRVGDESSTVNRQDNIGTNILPRERAETRGLAYEDDDDLMRLPTLYKLESQREPRNAADHNTGSIPDLSNLHKTNMQVLPREIVSAMSQHRREERMRERQEEERRNRNQLVIRLGDLMAWCEMRHVMLLIILLNLGFASLFYKLLY